MALRRRVAERIATPLKRAGMETPILNEIPHRAEEISALYYQAVETRGQVGGLLKIPAFAHGKAYGETAGFWYRVTFPKPINNPNVVVVAEGRKGEIPEVKVPTISIPRVGLPTLKDITIPDIVIPQLYTTLGRFECGWVPPLPGITDGLNNLMGRLEQALVKINEIIMKTSDAVKKVRDNVKDVYDSITDFREKIQTSLNQYEDNIERSINDGLGRIIPALYKVWGLPSNMAISPVSIRNVTSTGFDFQSLGKFTIHWLVIGTRA